MNDACLCMYIYTMHIMYRDRRKSGFYRGEPKAELYNRE